VARQRADAFCPKDSLLPLLYSLQLFLYLSSTESCGSASTYHVSARWAHLTSVFQAAGMTEDACVASVAALASHAPDSCLIGNEDVDVAMRIMNLLAARSRRVLMTYADPITLSDQKKSLISRLVALFSNKSHSIRVGTELKTHPCLQVSSLAEILISSSDEESSVGAMLWDRFGVQLRLRGVLQAFFLEDGRLTVGTGSLSERIIVLIEVLVCLGTKIQRHAVKIDDFSNELLLPSMLEDYLAVTELVASLMHRLPDSYQEVHAPLRVALYIVASAALLPFQNFYEETLSLKNSPSEASVQVYACARALAEKGRGVFDDSPTCGIENESHVLLVAVKAAVTHMIDRFSRLQGKTENHTELLVGFLGTSGCLGNANQSDGQVKDISKCNSLWTLVNLYSMLKMDGDMLGSSIIADLGANLAGDSCEFDWCAALAITSCLSVNCISRAALRLLPKLSSGFMIDKAGRHPLSYIAQTELFACQVRLSLRVSNDSPITVMDIVEALFLEQNHIEAKIVGNPAANDALAVWVLSTIGLANSEFYESCGNLLGAIHHLESCIQHCRKLSSMCRHGMVTQLDAGQPFWVHLALSLLVTELSGRQVECMRRKAFLYGRLGRYRKAQGYVASLTHGSDGTTNPSGLTLYDGMVSLMEAATTREKIDWRLKLEIHALSTSLDDVVRGLCRWNQVWSASSDDCSKGNDVSVCIDYVHDMLSSKWTCKCSNVTL
jgi:hypothetical protein